MSSSCHVNKCVLKLNSLHPCKLIDISMLSRGGLFLWPLSDFIIQVQLMSKSQGNTRLMMKCFFGAIWALATVSWAGEVTEITHDLTGNALVAVYCQALNDVLSMISIGFNSFTNIRVFIDNCDQEDKNDFCDLEGDVYPCCHVNTTTPIKVPGVSCLYTFLNLYQKIPVATVSNLSDFGHETPVFDFSLVPVPRLCMLSPIPILNKTVHSIMGNLGSKTLHITFRFQFRDIKYLCFGS